MANCFDFAALADALNPESGRNVVTVAGAGLSTSAGIPDFRGPSGLYSILRTGSFNGVPVSQLIPPGFPVEAVFSIDLFRLKPEIFYRVAASIRSTLVAAKPTPAHYLLRILAESNVLKCHFTQNVDGLERAAGICPSKLVEAHGTFQTASCLDCKSTYDLSWLNSKVNSDSNDTNSEIVVPHCDVCSGLVKPDVVLFGEALPSHFFQRAQIDMKNADVLIIFGASLLVQPFASLPAFVPPTCDRVFVSLDEPPALLSDWQKRLTGKDSAFQGTCDDFAWELAKAMGKGDELKSFVGK